MHKEEESGWVCGGDTRFPAPVMEDQLPGTQRVFWCISEGAAHVQVFTGDVAVRKNREQSFLAG